MRNELIKTLENMMNGDAVSDIKAFNDFTEDFIEYMKDMYDMESNEVMSECGLVCWSGRKWGINDSKRTDK